MQQGKDRLSSREHTSHSKHSFNNPSVETQEHHQMVNTEVRLIIFFEAKDGDALYSQQKQDWELIVEQIMTS